MGKCAALRPERIQAGRTVETVSEEIPEPEAARPWRGPEDGPWPVVRTWPAGAGPALEVWSAGRWRYAPVLARQDWADGSVYDQVSVDLRGETSATTRMYRWPQPGLRVAHGSRSEPSTAPNETQRGGTPRARPRAGRGGAARAFGYRYLIWSSVPMVSDSVLVRQVVGAFDVQRCSNQARTEEGPGRADWAVEADASRDSGVATHPGSGPGVVVGLE